jgi:hypothetical protein
VGIIVGNSDTRVYLFIDAHIIETFLSAVLLRDSVISLFTLGPETLDFDLWLLWGID